jgi:hypothetical protein
LEARNSDRFRTVEMRFKQLLARLRAAARPCSRNIDDGLSSDESIVGRDGLACVFRRSKYALERVRKYEGHLKLIATNLLQ